MSDEVRQAQAALYGEPLSEVLRRCGQVLGLNQGELARTLGVSAPMLSQLINGHRVKIANPVAAGRLRAMNDSVAAVTDGRMDIASALATVASVQGGGDLLSTRRTAPQDDPVTRLEGALSRLAPASEYLAAADVLGTAHPGVAELLRILGSGRADLLLAPDQGE